MKNAFLHVPTSSRRAAGLKSAPRSRTQNARGTSRRASSANPPLTFGFSCFDEPIAGLSWRLEAMLVCSTLGFSKPVENHAHVVAVGSFFNMWSIAQTRHLRGTESSPSRAP